MAADNPIHPIPEPTPADRFSPLENVPSTIEPPLGDDMPKKKTTETILTPEPAPNPPTKPEPSKPALITYSITGNRSSGFFIVRTPPDAKRIPLPINAVAALPPKYRKMAQPIFTSHSYYGLTDIIYSTDRVIPLPVWAEAIAKADILQASMPTTGEATVKQPLQQVYLAVDDCLYSLKPIALVGTNRALAAARKRITEEATALKTKLVAEAKASAADLTRAAQTSADSIILKANAKLFEAQDKLAEANNLPATWAISCGYPLLLQNNAWYFVLPCSLNIKEFHYNYCEYRRVWKAKVATPYIFQYLAPITTFAISSCRVAPNQPSFTHPHITGAQCCMGPGDAPNSLNSAASVAQLINAINRTLTAIDLNSMLLGGKPGHWHGDSIWRFVPDDLKKILEDSHYSERLQSLTISEINATNKPAAPKTSADGSVELPSPIIITTSKGTWHS